MRYIISFVDMQCYYDKFGTQQESKNITLSIHDPARPPGAGIELYSP